ncbi:Putative HotDog domain superfamily protein [Septoria linicola]|uniref:HotDog domain superfamily protein n=1 Tax=Septoria linicola TaxID=215465 RepID=A0A9Q9AP90_9PEZI|nr:putative HotDog domain superfamily protein [Septoria linicola]USW48326.1 Putative HotDog domain superfamily protein [Septoria linicola]
MSSARILRPCAPRPHLSLRYRRLNIRHASTTAPKQSFYRRYRSPITWSSMGIGLGLVLGGVATNFIAPPPMPQQGTHEDNVLMADLNKRIDEEFKVKVLRGKCLGVSKQLKGEEGGWVEIVPPITAPGADGTASGVGLLPFHDRLIDALQGAKGLGVERVFWDRDDKKLVAIVWFGGALSGWPGVTHGGLLATALAEKIALVGSLSGGGDTNVNSAVKPQRLPGTGNHATLQLSNTVPDEPAQLSVDYLKPTYANSFHVIRVQPAWASPDDVRLQIQGHEYLAVLETMDGKPCVKATAKFAPRSELEKVEESVKEAVSGWTYSDFKKWMWPSRQDETMAELAD